MAGPKKTHYPFAEPTAVKQHGRKTGGANGRAHEITPIAKPRGPSMAVKIAENAKQGEKPHPSTKVAAIKHIPKNVRIP